MVSVNAENSTAPVADGVTFCNPDSSNTTIIEVEGQEPFYKNGKAYKITAYVVLIDKNNPNLELGILLSNFKTHIIYCIRC